MGWLELFDWVGEMRRQQRGPEPKPESWEGADESEHWDELRAARERRRGRR